jgi:hypothetical protein
LIYTQGRALVGHVIKTLPLFKADCMTTCKETLSCFSINVYKDEHGGDMCDLNRSNKKQSPESFVHKTGHDYAEAPVNLELKFKLDNGPLHNCTNHMQIHPKSHNDAMKQWIHLTHLYFHAHNNIS